MEKKNERQRKSCCEISNSPFYCEFSIVESLLPKTYMTHSINNAHTEISRQSKPPTRRLSLVLSRTSNAKLKSSLGFWDFHNWKFIEWTFCASFRAFFVVVVNFPSHFSLIPPSSISCESSSENSRCDDVIYWFSQDQTRPKVVSSTQIDDEICSSFLRSSHMVKCRAFISDNFRFLEAFCSSSSLLRNLDLNFKEGKFCNFQKYGSV